MRVSTAESPAFGSGRLPEFMDFILLANKLLGRVRANPLEVRLCPLDVWHTRSQFFNESFVAKPCFTA